MTNEEILEAVCKEFHDNYFEDKWDDEREDGITKAMTRNCMRKALIKLWSLRPVPLSTDGETI